MAKKTLFFITTEFPWPAESGGRIKTFRLIEFLCKHFDVNLSCAYGNQSPEALRTFRERTGVKSVQIFGENKPRTIKNWFVALMKFPTFNTYRVYSKRMESMIKWGISKSDITIVDHMEMFEMIDPRQTKDVIYHSHNAEYKLWRDFAQLVDNPIKRFVLNWEADRVLNFERWVLNRCQFAFAAPNDSQALQDEFKIVSKKFRLTYHLGNDMLLDKPLVDITSNDKKIFYAGTLSWKPNEDGLFWFLNQCWPAITKQHPDAEFIVCGKDASDTLKERLTQTKGITFLGFVDNLYEVMQNCSCAIVPLRFGSGMKIKTFDALYAGLPLITTTIGAEGIELSDGVHALISDVDRTFSEAVCTILDDKQVSMKMAKEGRALVEEKYTYQHLFASMIEDLNETL